MGIRRWIKKRDMKVKVLFFGVLAEVIGTDSKIYMDVKSVDELKIRILDEFPELANYRYLVSLNNEIINDNHTTEDGDEVAFMPPFAGG